jgi:hypothetical protein
MIRRHPNKGEVMTTKKMRSPKRKPNRRQINPFARSKTVNRGPAGRLRRGPEQTPELGPEHQRLEVFAGSWKVEGENKSQAPDAPNTHVLGEESYEWLPGGFFLVGRWDRQFGEGGGDHTGIGILGYDAEKRTYFSRSFDNLGFWRDYEVRNERDRTWTFTGERERATFVFNKAGDSFDARWEIRGDNSRWQPLCELHAIKTG